MKATAPRLRDHRSMEFIVDKELERVTRRLVRRARVKVCLQAALRCATVLSGMLAALMVASIDVLAPAWIGCASVPALAIFFWHIRRHWPQPYVVLQQIDRRLELQDLLSTAYYFRLLRKGSTGEFPLSVVLARQATALARNLKPSRAIPFGRPALTRVAVLASAVLVFAYRYGHLDKLEPVELVRLSHPDLADPAEQVAQAQRAALDRQEQASKPPQPEQPTANHPGDPPRQAGDWHSNGPRPLELSIPAWQAWNHPRPDAPASPSLDPEDSDGHASEAGEHQQASTGSPSEGERSRSEEPSHPASELLQKMQDAFNKLLAKLKIPPLAGNGRRVTTAENSPNRQAQPGEESASESGEAHSGQPQNSMTASPRGEQAARQMAAATSLLPQGQAQGETQSQQGDSNLGIGKRDGAKDLRQARELEAFGKLEELFGQRAESLRGEVWVDVSSAQPDGTPVYKDVAASHRANRSAIPREKIPLELQPYIRAYFEKLHRAAGEAQTR